MAKEFRRANMGKRIVSIVLSIAVLGLIIPLSSNLAHAAPGDYIVTGLAGTIDRVTPAGVVTPIAAGLDPITSIAIDKNGDYVVVAFNGAIGKVSGGVFTPDPSSPLPSQLTDVAIDANGDYVVVGFNGLIGKVSGGVFTPHPLSPLAPGLTGISIDYNGDYIATGAGVIHQISGGINTPIVGLPNPLWGIAIDSFGDYIVTPSHAVGKVSGGIFSPIAGGLPNVTPNIAIDSNGDYIITAAQAPTILVKVPAPLGPPVPIVLSVPIALQTSIAIEPNPPEHFLTYQVNESKNTPKFEKTESWLGDLFGEGDYRVEKPYRLLNPVDKNDEGLYDTETHMVAYKLKQQDYKKTDGYDKILVENQFGEISLDIRKAKLLLVPSAKNHDDYPEELAPYAADHFKCYDVKVTKNTPKFEKRYVNVYDPNFDEDRKLEVKNPRLYCNPVQKIHGDYTGTILSPETPLVCYDVKKAKGEENHDRTSVFTNNQFGPEALDTKKEKELCVPSTITYPDNDKDGILANEDPDDSDPCNPSVNNQVCQAITNSPGEHFMSYQVKETKNTPKFKKFNMDLADKLGYGEVKVKKIQRLLNPVDKNNEGIQDEITHMVGYQIQKQDYTKYDGYDQIMVANQFGLINLDVKNPKLLLVPSAKSHDSTPDVLLTLNSHFTCYDVKVTKGTPNFKKIKADVYDPNFDEDRTMDVKKPRMFCNSMQTNALKAPNGVYGEQLLCYDVKKSKGEPKHDRTSVFTNNHYGPEELDTKKEKELCVPSMMINPGMTQVNPP